MADPPDRLHLSKASERAERCDAPSRLVSIANQSGCRDLEDGFSGRGMNEIKLERRKFYPRSNTRISAMADRIGAAHMGQEYEFPSPILPNVISAS